MHWSVKLGLTTIVFGIGAGLGHGWRQGWIPVELLPPPAGVLDPQAADAESGDPAGAIVTRPLARSEEPTVPLEAVVADQREPDVVVASAALTLPRVQRRNSAGDGAESDFAPPAPPVEEPPTEAVVQVGGPSRTASAVEQTQFTQPTATARPGTQLPAAPATFMSTVNEADRLIGELDWLGAHKQLSKLYWSHPDRRSEIQDRLDQTATTIFFSPQPHFLEPRVLEPSEQLRTIAQKQQLSWEYLAKLNRVDPKRIRAGQRLKMINGPFAAVVELDDFSMTVHLLGYYVKRFPVGVGKDGASPIGKFAVLNKVVNPQYTDPEGKVIDGDDPRNPLGERWIDLGNSYGIHGTIDPDSIGKASSRGCIRLRDADIIEVYDLLINGSEVVIRR